MELFIAFLFLFLRTEHIRGFSHLKRKGWRKLFILSLEEDLEVYVDGYPTGLITPCQIYIEPSKQDLFLQLRRQGRVIHEQGVLIQHSRSYVLGQAGKLKSFFA
ncbi:MAG: hypothetical protein KDD33_08110 [Bdellovibrionales bacterium]|nr:hypothetical protein [Bdellovibrionales bacterium]